MSDTELNALAVLAHEEIAELENLTMQSRATHERHGEFLFSPNPPMRPACDALRAELRARKVLP